MLDAVGIAQPTQQYVLITMHYNHCPTLIAKNTKTRIGINII